MKVSDEMIDAAVKAWNDSYIFDTTLAMRAAVEAAIAAHVPLTKSQAAKARWAATSPEDRRASMATARKKILEIRGY